MNSRDEPSTAEEVRRRIEILHGNVVAQRAGNSPPTDKEETLKASYLAGRLAGLQSALSAFEDDLTTRQDSEVNAAYRALSQQFQDVNDVAAVNPGQDRERGGFQ